MPQVYTMQQAFDTAARGVIEQGGPAMNMEATCQYLNEDGLKCGVGHLLPDDKTRKDWDLSVGAIVDLADDDELWPAAMAPKLEAAGLTGLSRRFLEDLQKAHDNPANKFSSNYLADFRQNMRDLAEKWELDPKVVS